MLIGTFARANNSAADPYPEASGDPYQRLFSHSRNPVATASGTANAVNARRAPDGDRV